MAGLVPTVGAKGRFTLKTPFTLDTSVAYVCSSVRTFDEIISSKADPFTLVYKPVGLTEQDAAAARVSDVVIVTLLSGVGNPVHVPSDHILGYDNSALIPHQFLIVTAPCGLFPVGYNTTRIKEAVQNALVEYTGIEVEPMIVVKDVADAITQAAAQAAEDARQVAMSYRTTTLGDKIKLENENQALRDENAKLIEIIEQLQAENP